MTDLIEIEDDSMIDIIETALNSEMNDIEVMHYIDTLHYDKESESFIATTTTMLEVQFKIKVDIKKTITC